MKCRITIGRKFSNFFSDILIGFYHTFEGTLEIPLHGFPKYLNAFLFPNTADLTKSSQNGIRRENKEGLDRLFSLLRNSNFTQISMRAIEKQTTVTARDRAKLASYLTAVFADDPEYLTKITFILVGHYMKEKASDRSPKLAFRRADSVAEKMISHWLHLSLFDHIQGESGRNLWVSLNFKLRPTLRSLFRLKKFLKS